MNSKETTSTAFAFQGLGKMKKSSGSNNSNNKKKSSTTSSSTTTMSASFKKQRGAPEHKFPVEPTIISMVHKPREYMNHSYRDFSNVPAEIGYEHPTSLRDMTFSQKVHDILSQPEYKPWINWHPHGRSFKIFVPMYFERNVCDKYFGHKRYSSFLRQLNNFGFKHISKGPDRNSYYHEFFLEGRPHLCKYMPLCKDARRLVPDPENEPDFYQISAQYPLHTATTEQAPLQEEQQQKVAQGVTSDQKMPQDEEDRKPAAVVKKLQPELHPAVTTSSASFALTGSNATLPADAIRRHSLAVPVFAGPVAAATCMASPLVVVPTHHTPAATTLQSQIESVSSRIAAGMPPPPSAAATTSMGPPVSAAVPMARASVNNNNSNANFMSSPPLTPSSLGPRLASEVSWLLHQLPPSKIYRPTTSTAPAAASTELLTNSYHAAATAADTATLLRALDVAQARRLQQEAAAAALARQQQQEEEAALAAAVMEAALARRQEQQQQQQQRQEAVLLAAVQERQQQILSRLLGVDMTQNNNNSNINNNYNSAQQDTLALLEYIRRMKQHDGEC